MLYRRDYLVMDILLDGTAISGWNARHIHIVVDVVPHIVVMANMIVETLQTSVQIANGQI